jgi:hypothetical protein
LTEKDAKKFQEELEKQAEKFKEKSAKDDVDYKIDKKEEAL